jgi:hypothetical protein
LTPVPFEKRLARLLDHGMLIAFEDSTKRADQIALLARVGRTKIELDPEALKTAKVDKNTSVPLQLSANLTLRAWLNLSLARFGLTYISDGDGLKAVRRTSSNDALARPSERQKTENGRIEKALEQPVSFDFHGEPLKKVVLVLDEKTHESFVLDPIAHHAGTIKPEITVSGSSDKEPLSFALKKLLAAVGLTYVVRDEAIVLTRTP